MDRVWVVCADVRGFKFKVYIRATEKNLEYLKTELPEYTSYSGATCEEVELATKLGLPIYCYKEEY